MLLRRGAPSNTMAGVQVGTLACGSILLFVIATLLEDLVWMTLACLPPPPLILGLLRWRSPSLVHYFLPLLVSLSLSVSKLRLGGLYRWKGRGFGLVGFLGRVSPSLGFQQLLESRPWLALYCHSF